MQGSLSHNDIIMITVAIIIGTLVRIWVLKEDYRQYPSYPNGYLIHLVTGFVAASLGAVALPALLSKNFVAVTFLTLALQQFRDVRSREKESLTDLEATEYAYRGAAYIDGIAKTFESRNYLAFISSLVVTIVITALKFNIWINVIVGVIVGLFVGYLLKRFTKGKSIGDIAKVKPGKIEVKDSSLFVDDIFVSNLLGTENAEKLMKEEGMAVVIHPNADHFRINLDNFGQRQAALFEATRALGNKRYNFTRKNYADGRIVIALVPVKRDMNILIKTVEKCPLLESTKKAQSLMDLDKGGKSNG